jgi:hypothetical protein
MKNSAGDIELTPSEIREVELHIADRSDRERCRREGKTRMDSDGYTNWRNMSRASILEHRAVPEFLQRRENRENGFPLDWTQDDIDSFDTAMASG